MKAALYASLLAVPLMLSPQLASAQGSGHPCKADQEKLCPGLKPGDGKFGPCMKQHEAELSPECAAFRKEGQERRKAVRMNCKADAEKLCADVAKGEGALVKCLKGHEGELAQACADALKAMPAARR